MKKSLSVFIVGLVVGICFCFFLNNQNEKTEPESNSQTFTIESFCDKFEGCWGYWYDNAWDVIQIKDERLSFFTYQGHSWYNGDITKIKQTDDSLIITIFNEPVSWPDDPPTEGSEIELVFFSKDNFSDNLIIELDIGSFSMSYLGETIDDVGESVNKIESVLNRKILFNDIPEIYEAMNLDWNSWSEYADHTFLDIFKNSFDMNDLYWSFDNLGDSNIETLSFGGTANSIKGEALVMIIFVLNEDSGNSYISGFMIKNDEETLEYDIQSVASKYGFDYDVAMVSCDAVSGILLLSSFINF